MTSHHLVGIVVSERVCRGRGNWRLLLVSWTRQCGGISASLILDNGWVFVKGLGPIVDYWTMTMKTFTHDKIPLNRAFNYWPRPLVGKPPGRQAKGVPTTMTWLWIFSSFPGILDELLEVFEVSKLTVNSPMRQGWFRLSTVGLTGTEMPTLCVYQGWKCGDSKVK